MVSIDVDIDDILWGMSKWDKQNMADALYEDEIIPKALQAEYNKASERNASTNLEIELSDLLDAIYSNKMFLNNDDLETLKHLSKKGL